VIREMGEEIRGVKYVYCDPKFVLFRMLVRRICEKIHHKSQIFERRKAIEQEDHRSRLNGKWTEDADNIKKTQIIRRTLMMML